MNTIRAAIAAIIWLAMILGGTGVLYVYGTQPGELSATPVPKQWPTDTALPHAADTHTLLLFAHPHCPCTRATIEQFQRVLVRSRVQVVCHLIFVAPSGVDESWMKSSIVVGASRIPGVTVHHDLQAEEARRFGATTSGHVLLYDPRGELVFTGGITSMRGHGGDNFASDSLITLLGDAPERAEISRTPVYGCPLFNADDCRETETPCRN